MKKLLRCIHRHTIDEHPNCFARGLVQYEFKDDREWEKLTGKPWYTYPGYKIGYFDIETDNLKADFGTVLSWCIKEKGGEIFSSTIKKEELFSGVYDKRIVEEFVKKMKEFNILVGYNSCFTKGHRVLKSDLTWVNVEELKEGDKLLAFDDEIQENKRSRNFKETVVLRNIPVIDDVYKITLKSGKTLVVTGNHPWLVQRHKNWGWRKTTELIHPNNNINSLTKILNVWDTIDNRDIGYLAGFFDSEGGIYQAIKRDKKTENYNMFIYATQHSIKNKNVLDKITMILNNTDFKFDIRSYDKNHLDQKSIYIRGGKAELLRFIGSVRLEKLTNLDLNKLGELPVIEDCEIESIEYIGKDIVYGLGTESGTYIAEGFPVHNTYFDMPFMRTKALHYNLEFPGYGELYHMDLYFTVKSKLNLSRKSLESACDYLGIKGKTPIDKDIWRRAKYGDPKALQEVLVHNKGDVIILEELHNKLDFTSKWIRKSI